jgi:hypothetical protein
MVDIDEPTSGTSTPPAPVLPKPSARSKWQDEDKEESEEVNLSFVRASTFLLCSRRGRGREGER